MMYSPPAFPRPVSNDSSNGSQADGDKTVVQQDGMNLRDYFAAKAMQSAMLGNYGGQDPPPDVIAVWAYSQADAMLKARLIGEQQ